MQPSAAQGNSCNKQTNKCKNLRNNAIEVTKKHNRIYRQRSLYRHCCTTTIALQKVHSNNYTRTIVLHQLHCNNWIAALQYQCYSNRNKITFLAPCAVCCLVLKWEEEKIVADDIGLLEACSLTNGLTWINCAICKVNLTARCNFPPRFQSGCLASGVLVLNLAADSTFPTNH